MTIKLVVNVSFDPMRGYVSKSSPQLTRSLTALSLAVLKKRITAAAVLRRKAGTTIDVKLELDRAARAARDERLVQAHDYLR